MPGDYTRATTWRLVIAIATIFLALVATGAGATAGVTIAEDFDKCTEGPLAGQGLWTASGKKPSLQMVHDGKGGRSADHYGGNPSWANNRPILPGNKTVSSSKVSATVYAQLNWRNPGNASPIFEVKFVDKMGNVPCSAYLSSAAGSFASIGWQRSHPQPPPIRDLLRIQGLFARAIASNLS